LISDCQDIPPAFLSTQADPTLLLPLLQSSPSEAFSMQEISITGFYPSDFMDKSSPRKPSNSFGIYFFL
jgi:hypothetical protein